MTPVYKGSILGRFVQRFAVPLYKKKLEGGYSFSCTLTHLKYKGYYVYIFACHALSNQEINNNDIDFMLVLSADGYPIFLKDVCSYKIYKDQDIVICVSKDFILDQKNYFCFSGVRFITKFKVDAFGWLGFPAKKSKDYDKTKSNPDKIKQDIFVSEEGKVWWTSSKYLIVYAKYVKTEGSKIEGETPTHNVEYSIEGIKDNASSFRGMSGGAFFYCSKKYCDCITFDRNVSNYEKSIIYPEIKVENDYIKFLRKLSIFYQEQITEDDLFFLGIGLEHDGKGKITGCSSETIFSLLDKQIKELD